MNCAAKEVGGGLGGWKNQESGYLERYITFILIITVRNEDTCLWPENPKFTRNYGLDEKNGIYHPSLPVLFRFGKDGQSPRERPDRGIRPRNHGEAPCVRQRPALRLTCGRHVERFCLWEDQSGKSWISSRRRHSSIISK